VERAVKAHLEAQKYLEKAQEEVERTANAITWAYAADDAEALAAHLKSLAF
jgi:hypothetical protein